MLIGIRSLRINILAPLLLLTPLIIAISSTSHAKFELPNWKRDAQGYRAALTVAKGFKEPALIYYNKKNCGWCRRLNNNYFRNRSVAAFLKNYSKVEINPERSKKNASLAEKHDIKEYPTLLLSLPHVSSSKRNISPFARARSMTPEEFIEHIQQQLASIYNEAAMEAFKQVELQKAEKWQLKAIENHQQSVHYLFQMGQIYDTWGSQTQLKAYQQKAANFYKKALQLDANHELSKTALHNLRS